MVITSTENSKIKELKKLNDKKYRDIDNKFLIEGEHLVKEAYTKGLLEEILMLEGMESDINIPITYVSESVIKYLSNLTNPTTMIGICSKIKEKADFGNKILILDNIQDPGNLGTIIRSAVAFNINTIVLGKGTVDIYNSKVLRATQGLIFHINIIERDLISFLPNLKADNYKIIGSDISDGIEIKKYHTPSKYALIMGNEGHGLDINIKTMCDENIYIKMNNACESLNVAVACSIILNQLDEE